MEFLPLITSIHTCIDRDSTQTLTSQLELISRSFGDAAGKIALVNCIQILFHLNGHQFYFQHGSSPRFDETKAQLILQESVNGRNVLRFENSFCVPFGNESSYGAILCSKADEQCFAAPEEVLLSIFAENIAIAAERSAERELHLFEGKIPRALQSILSARTAEESLDVVLSTSIKAIDALFQPHLLTLFICDSSRQEIFVWYSKAGADRHTVPFGVGAAGVVASNGRSIRTDNMGRYSQIQPSFRTSDDSLSTHGILCAAVVGFEGHSKPFAVIELVNSSLRGYFLREEQEALELLCQDLSCVLQTKALDALELTRSGWKDLEPTDMESSVLVEYGAKLSKREQSSAEKMSLSDATPVLKIEAINHHSFDPFVHSEEALIEFAIGMFTSYKLLETFCIPVDVLRLFLEKVRMTYHPENSFHNFKHAFGTMHLTYTLLRKGADLHLSMVDILAILIAAICHDCDHPGHNNAFEAATGTDRSILYANDSVLERHHTAVTLRLLASPDMAPLFGNLPAEARTEMREQITAAILATDMARHFKLVDEITQRSRAGSTAYSIQDPAARRALMTHVLHCADIGAQSQRTALACKWTEALVAEFSAQAARELELGLPVTPFMQGLGDERAKMKLQVEFINKIVIPLWAAIAACFPSVDYAVQQLHMNQGYYNTCLERAVAAASVAEECKEA